MLVCLLCQAVVRDCELSWNPAHDILVQMQMK